MSSAIAFFSSSSCSMRSTIALSWSFAKRVAASLDWPLASAAAVASVIDIVHSSLGATDFGPPDVAQAGSLAQDAAGTRGPVIHKHLRAAPRIFLRLCRGKVAKTAMAFAAITLLDKMAMRSHLL